jgi:branched-chain amino acid transport system ATP-binding protein
VLRERRDRRAQVLSGGEQQMLAIARSLLMAPAILLIDEPSMGLAPLLVRRIFGVMGDVFRRHGISVLLVEQDTAVALALASDAYLLEQGRITAHAPAADLAADPRLRQAYLGSADALGTPPPPVPDVPPEAP